MSEVKLFGQDIVQFMSRHLDSWGNSTLFPKQKSRRQSLIVDWLGRYHTAGVSKAEKDLLTTLIIVNTWYLFPHVLSKKKLPPRIFPDALQNMVIASIKAIKKYNPARMSDARPGTKVLFRSYVAKYLQDAMAQSCRQDAIVTRPPRPRRGARNKQASPIIETVEFSTLPEDQDVDNRERFDRETEQLIQPKSHAITADMVKSDVDVEKTVEDQELISLLEEAIDLSSGALTEKERSVLIYRYGVFGAPKLTLDQIAQMFRTQGNCCTKVWVFQIEKRALKKLRAYLTNTLGVSREDVVIRP